MNRKKDQPETVGLFLLLYINYCYFCVLFSSPLIITAEIARSWLEYQSLPDREWRKDYFNWETGGYVATHVLKEIDNLKRPGIAAEVKACHELARIGKRILRLPENTPNQIDSIIIDGKTYRELLKFKPGSGKPRGYPDAYFDGQTWDFKAPGFKKDDTIRQLIKNGRKADNLIFITEYSNHIESTKKAIGREYGKRITDNSWIDLPNVYCQSQGELIQIWIK